MDEVTLYINDVRTTGVRLVNERLYGSGKVSVWKVDSKDGNVEISVSGVMHSHDASMVVSDYFILADGNFLVTVFS